MKAHEIFIEIFCQRAESRRNLHTHTHTHTHTQVNHCRAFKQIGTICLQFLFSIFTFFYTPIVRADVSCATGYAISDSTKVNESSFMKVGQNGCDPGYELYTAAVYDLLYILPDVTSRCPAGQYYNSGSCVSYAQDNCPSGYYGCAPTNSFAIYNSNGECDTNYSSYGDVALCPLYGVGDDTASFCTPLCNYGYNHTHADTCARSCPYPNMSAMHSSLGHRWPLYLDKTTFPALNVQTNDGTCYINLLPGNIDGTLNFKYQNGEYHVVE